MTSETPDESLAWTVRLSDSAPGKLVGVWVAAVTAGVVGYVLFTNLLFGLLGFAIILAATAEFWLGTRYSLGPKGASARVGFSPTVVDWTNVKRVVVEGRSVKLSPLSEEGRLDPFRGVVMRTTEENHQKVVELVRNYCGDDVRFLGQGTD